jgi:hypothetical protein
MLEMRSTLSDEADNGPYSPPQESSHIRTGARVIHSRSFNPGDIQRRRHVGNAAVIRDGDDVRSSSSINNNIRNNSKYEKKDDRSRRQRGGRWNKMLLFNMLPTVFFIVAIVWMLSSLHVSSPQRLRRDDVPAPVNSPEVHTRLSAPSIRIQLREKIEESENVIANANNVGPRDTTFEIGTKLRKKFTEDNGKRKYYSGTIESFDSKEGIYNIVYEDG